MNFKNLVSPLEEERNSEFQLLPSYFKNNILSKQDYLKIFKAIYYNYWLCDGKKSGEKSLQISKLLSISKEKIKFVQYFLQTLDREWESIDFLRLDKFYLLTRTFFKEIAKFKHFKNLKEILLDILESGQSKRGFKLFLVQVLTEEILLFKYSKSLIQIYYKLLDSEDIYKVNENIEKILKSKKISIKHKQEILKNLQGHDSKKLKIIQFFKIQQQLKKFKKLKTKKNVQWAKELEKVKIFSKKDCVSPNKN